MNELAIGLLAGIPSLLIAAGTLVFGVMQLRKKASNGWAQRIEDRLQQQLEECTRDRRHLEKRVEDLTKEKMVLLERLVGRE